MENSYKAQAALEYLITYSWAIVVLSLVIGIIASSGAFSLSSYTKDYCLLPSQLICSNIY